MIDRRIYEHSERGRATKRAWEQSEGGKASIRRSNLKCRENRLETGTRSRAKLRAAVFLKYGLSCRMCGETDLRVLTINHLNGGGTKELDEFVGNRFYQKILNEDRQDIEILCSNCNIRYEYEQGRRKEKTIEYTREYIERALSERNNA